MALSALASTSRSEGPIIIRGDLREKPRRRLNFTLGAAEMIPRSCVAIQTKKFPVLAGEDEEIVNPNMYGKALCKYLEQNLPKAGIKVPTFCAEDWGWWIEIQRNDFTMGLCIYSDLSAEKDTQRYAVLPSITKEKKWSWSRFKSVDVSTQATGVMDAVENIFRNDSEITAVTRHDEFPF
jgi:hypothetical protein